MDISYKRLSFYGKPHLTADKMCFVCGRPAGSSHHIVPKGIGGGSRYVEVAGKRLESARIDVCGTDNVTGCHGRFHHHEISVSWEWNEPEYEELWNTGQMFTDYGITPHSERLYEYGYYVLQIGQYTREYHGN